MTVKGFYLFLYSIAWAQWVARLTRNVEVVGSSPIKGLLVSLSKKVYPYCLVLVGSRFEEQIRA